jgi:hypothetical protein
MWIRLRRAIDQLLDRLVNPLRREGLVRVQPIAQPARYVRRTAKASRVDRPGSCNG